MKNLSVLSILSLFLCFTIQLHAQIYVAHRNPRAITAFNFDGTVQDTVVVDDISTIVLKFNPVDSQLYYGNRDVGANTFGIERCRLDGSDREEIISSNEFINDLFIYQDEHKLYWLKEDTKTFYRSNFDGTEIDTLFSVPERAVSFTIDTINHHFYWITYDDIRNDKIRRAEMDGANEEILVDSLTFPGRLRVYNNQIYWSEDSDNRIRRSDLDGSNIETLIQLGAQDYPFDFQIDGDRDLIYWADYGQDHIARMSLNDTTQLDTLVTDLLREPRTLAIVLQMLTDVREVAQAELDLRLFPNPARDFIYLDYEGTKALEVEIYDLMGRLLRYFPNRWERTFYVGDLGKGVYVVRVKSEMEQLTRTLFLE